MAQSPPVALTIAGSDCSCGAGMQADLKTFQHFGVHGLTAVTCVVSETANVVRAVYPVPVEVMVDQVELLFDAFPVAAVKTGMLFSAGHVRAVADILAKRPQVPVVVDPVMVASTGDLLLEPEAVDVYQRHLLPLARVITPNLPEAETLLGRSITGPEELEDAARDLAGRFGTAVLLKGGHLPGPECLDVLADDGRVRRFPQVRLAVAASHGTGCTLSSAIAAAIARGTPLAEAVGAAKHYLVETLRRAYAFSSPAGGMIHALNQGTGFGKNEA